LLFAAAVVLLAEEWLWDTLRRGMQALSALAAVRAFERWLQRLAPRPALAMLVTPALVLVPFKFAGMWTLAHGHWLLGCAVVIAAKVVGMALAAFVFANVKDSARRLVWFDRLYRAVMSALAWARSWLHAQPAYRRTRVAVARLMRWLRSVGGAGAGSARLRRWAAARRLARARR
jgi:hypothetical protein